MQLKYFSLFVSTLLTLLTSPLALAHTGHGYTAGFADGFMHPVTGLDHLAVAIAVGFWAASCANCGIRQMSFFMSLFAGGMLLGLCSLMFPELQLGYLLAVLMIVVFIGGSIAIPGMFNWFLFGSFAIFHGMTHLREMPVEAVPFAFMAGLFVATGMLLLFGFMLRQVVSTRKAHSQTAQHRF